MVETVMVEVETTLQRVNAIMMEEQAQQKIGPFRYQEMKEWNPNFLVSEDNFTYKKEIYFTKIMGLGVWKLVIICSL